MRVLSGIQPTGRFHWGNYFGAIRQYIDLQGEAQNAFYFIANLHALTTVRERERLWQSTLDAAIDLLALGLDPERATLFVQSDVPEVSELCWPTYPDLLDQNLLADAELARQIDRVLEEAGGTPGHVFNLGHGIEAASDPERVAFLVEHVHRRTAQGGPR